MWVTELHNNNYTTKISSSEYVTALIRRMGEGNIFSLFVSPQPREGGGEYPLQVLMGRYPILPNEVPPSFLNFLKISILETQKG